MLLEGETAGLVVLPDENTLDRSVAVSEWSNELLAYEEDTLVESDTADAAAAPAPYSLGSYVRAFIGVVTLALPGPHCCSCVVRFPVVAIVTFDDPGGGRGPDGCELPLDIVDDSNTGYWWKSPPARLS
jgi:hypothetical protein